ncbi:MAG: FecR domain-containing protein [Planctomycetes bacterium]|nr:FecR domain-containing protein [Planctomycetota bacterium]
MGNHDMKEKDEQLLLELIHRHIDGGLREDEKRKLEMFLNNSAEARRIYVREMKFHASMKEILGGIDFDILEERLSDELSSDSAQLVPEDGKEAAQKKSPQSEQRPTGAGRHLRRYRATGTRSPWRVMFAVAACLALIVGAFLLNAAFQGNLDRWFGNDRKTAAGSKELAPAVATLQEVVGNVEIRREGATAPASVGLSLQPDDKLLIGEQAGATVRVEDGTSIQLRERTRFQLESGKRFHLQRGELDANVVKQSADQEVRFTTPHAAAVVLGTELNLSTGEITRLEVREGRVELSTFEGRRVVVNGGSYAVAEKINGSVKLVEGRMSRGDSVSSRSINLMEAGGEMDGKFVGKFTWKRLRGTQTLRQTDSSCEFATWLMVGEVLNVGGILRGQVRLVEAKKGGRVLILLDREDLKTRSPREYVHGGVPSVVIGTLSSAKHEIHKWYNFEYRIEYDADGRLVVCSLGPWMDGTPRPEKWSDPRTLPEFFVGNSYGIGVVTRKTSADFRGFHFVPGKQPEDSGK